MELRRHFKNEGYVIVRNAFDEQKLDNFVAAFENLKKAHGQTLYFSQSQHNWREIKDDLDAWNCLDASILNFTDNPWLGQVALEGANILQSFEMQSSLELIGCTGKYNMWQNMLFDKSTATVDHIDSWYLIPFARSLSWCMGCP